MTRSTSHDPATSVSAQDLADSQRAIGLLPAHDRRDPEAQFMAILRLYPGQRDKVFEVFHRTTAMQKLIDLPPAAGWVSRKKDGAIRVDMALVELAAREPLIMRKSVRVFDAHAFFEKLSQPSPDRLQVALGHIRKNFVVRYARPRKNKAPR